MGSFYKENTHNGFNEVLAKWSSLGGEDVLLPTFLIALGGFQERYLAIMGAQSYIRFLILKQTLGKSVIKSTCTRHAA